MKIVRSHIIIFLFIVVLIAGAFFLSFGVIFAQGADYVPLSPLPGGDVDTKDPGGYFANLFRILVSVAAILAVIMLMVSGLQYMMSESFGGKESAKKRMWAAVLGIVLLLTSYIILFTINPDLVKLPFDSLRGKIERSVIQGSDGGSGNDGNSGEEGADDCGDPVFGCGGGGA